MKSNKRAKRLSNHCYLGRVNIYIYGASKTLKGHSHKKVAEITGISLYIRFGPNLGMPTLFKFLKLSVKKLRLFMWGRSRYKMGSVAKPVHFCAAPAPACQKFRLRLRPFSQYIFETNQKFSWFQKNFIYFKTKNYHKKVL
jgi:hypothetical protein